ncbi:TonB-dependent receptor [Flavobacterium sp.]|uniref:TonB-dependent receptor n=1 Tax=Flavobacterium sp. TaxID=239 RepID=UPI0039E4CBCB
MRKILLFLLVLSQFPVFAQENDQRITASFENLSRMAAIEKIEQVAHVQFYFDPNWLKEDNGTVSGNFNDAPLSEVLQTLVSNTTLNFYVDGNRVILTRNSVIYDHLPDQFFGQDTSAQESEEGINKPVFRQQYDSISSGQQNRIAFIGKENKKNESKSYTISGTITDNQSGEGVANISIRVLGKKISTVTDANGNYSLQLPTGIHTLSVESVGHQKVTRKIVVYSNGRLHFGVTEKVNMIEEVNVKSKKNQAIRTAVTGVTTIEAEGIKNVPLIFGERDVLRVAIAIPGIKTAGEGAAGFNVRGGKEDQNLFLLDNALLYNPTHFFGFFSALNPYTTKKVDIYKGSIPAEFGGRLSSVFDISTKNGDTEKFMGEAGIGPVTSNISLSTPIVKGKSSLLVGGRAAYSNWILKQLDDESLKNSKAGFYDGILKYVHKINDKNAIESTVYYSHDSFSISSDSLYKYSNRLVSLKWNHAFNDKNKGALILTNTEYKFGIDYENNGREAFDFGYRVNETQMMLKMNYQMNAKHKFSYGLSSKYYGINPGDLDPIHPETLLVPIRIQKEKALESALYVSDSYKVNEKLLIDVGLRYSFYAALGDSQQRVYEAGKPKSDASVVETKTYGNNEVMKTYGGLEPRIAARYFLMEDLSVKFGYDKTFQYLHLLSSNTTQSPTDTWKLSDTNVKPQRAQQFSLGLYQNLADDVYEISLERLFQAIEKHPRLQGGRRIAAQ